LNALTKVAELYQHVFKYHFKQLPVFYHCNIQWSLSNVDVQNQTMYPDKQMSTVHGRSKCPQLMEEYYSASKVNFTLYNYVVSDFEGCNLFLTPACYELVLISFFSVLHNRAGKAPLPQETEVSCVGNVVWSSAGKVEAEDRESLSGLSWFPATPTPSLSARPLPPPVCQLALIPGHSQFVSQATPTPSLSARPLPSSVCQLALIPGHSHP